ncbi:sugar transferase [Psychromarinibacter sp. S121]|uniref:sugar transferase n=1 Tax=Psychromarinibacter sp. S121 TaxID=3415127 RepID=UPI003C7C50A3
MRDLTGVEADLADYSAVMSMGEPRLGQPRLRPDTTAGGYIRSQGSAAGASVPTSLPSRGASANTPVAPTKTSRPTSFYRARGKRLLDIAFVLLTLPFTLPLLMMGALMVARGGGRIIYVQDRVGQGGKIFRMVKFRTMVADADERLEACLEADPEMRAEWDRTQKLKNDPRITRYGKFLRRVSLDELPQLLNVLRGDMSIVGPRPMMPHQVEQYGDTGPYMAHRPGLTGVWQVMERNESDFTSRALADREYDMTCSAATDLRLIFRTVGVVLQGTGY